MPSSSAIQWQVQLDTLRDGAYGASIDDLSAYVIDMDWQNGFASSASDLTEYDGVAPPARARITLDNTGKEFNQETLGTERLTNGSFATWSGGNPSSWTVTGESGSNPEISQVGADKAHGEGGTGSCNIYSTSATVSISQTVLTSGTTYRITLNVTNLETTAGGIRVYAGTRLAGYLIQQAGLYTFYVNANGTGFKIESYLACDVTVDDVSVKATALYSGLLVPGTLVRIRGVYNSTTYKLFEGLISTEQGIAYTINAKSGNVRDQAVVLTVEDGMLKLLDLEYKVPLLTSATVDQALTRLFDDAAVAWPYAVGQGTLLGIQGTNTLGLNAKLYSQSVTSFETGKQTFAYLGDLADTTSDGVSAQGYARDLVMAEGGGRFWFEAREGKFKFHNREHDALNETTAGTYAQSDFKDMGYEYGDQMANEITINYTAHALGAADSVVWTHDALPIELTEKGKTINVRYHAAGNKEAKVGVMDGRAPTPNIDYTGTLTANGQTDLTRYLTVSVDYKATGAEVKLSHTFTGYDKTVWVQSLQLRGTPLTQQNMTVIKRDADSIARYGYAPRSPKTMRLVDDDDYANSLAGWWLARFKKPAARISTTALNGMTPAANRTTALTRVIGDKITLTDSFSSHSGSYVIVGEKHTVRAPGQVYDVTWTLKPMAREQIYVLGRTGKNTLDTAGLMLGL